ncbi:MAG: uracil phosphoribosyltransferase [Bacteroidetes bacterium]|nr:uracil phosphoribosyltransferase [Bacteroidota bacterium]
MLYNFSDQTSIAGKYVAQLRDSHIQKDRMRFRKNLERLAGIMGYEISKKLNYVQVDVETPLGQATAKVPDDKIVLATILRAGLPMQQGLLNVFDDAGSAFVSAYRRHHKDGSFEINLEYISCPSLEGNVLILSDPMLATGASIKTVLDALLENGTPKEIHIITAIASAHGLDQVRRFFPNARIWAGDIDEELTAKSYIVPGLGDAGDLAFGEKLQD